MRFLLGMLACSLVSALSAQTTSAEPGPTTTATTSQQIPEATVDVDITIRSNFIDRGEDRGRNRAVQRGTAYSSREAPGYFQPSVKFNTPVEGLYFSVFTSMAMSHRNDTDVDQRLETGPAGDQTILADSANRFVNTAMSPQAYVADQLNTAYTGNIWPTRPIANVPVYRFYKDANGLKRGDQVDLSMGYSSATTIGTFDFGIISSTRLDPRGKSNPFGDAGANYQKTEMYVSYALPFLPDVSLLLLSDVVNSDQYWKLSYGKEIEISETQKIDAGIAAAYGVQSNLQGLMDVPLTLGYTISGFRIGVEAVCRPQSKMYDAGYSGDTNTPSAIQIDGASNIVDRRIPDPSKTKGFANQVVNGMIQSSIRERTGNTSYNYTPRQRIPRWLYSVNLGYSTSL